MEFTGSAAVKTAGLVDTLQGPGPFTVFAQTNAAFTKLPMGTVDSLLKPQMKEKLVAVLTYHVVPGHPTVKDLWDASNKGGGTAKFKTVEGEELTVEFKGQALTIRDTKGNASRVTIQNVFQSNDVIHVIDSVLMPSSWLTPGCSAWPSAHSASIGSSPSRPRGGLFVWLPDRWSA